MASCYIGLVANLNAPDAQITLALQALHKLPKTRFIAYSSLYGSKPLGPQDQPDYLNAVAHIDTELTPLELLDALQQQERDQGREKLRHWGERCIDLDILLYDDLQLHSERLNIPHLELAKRSFVVVPLAELAPELRLPSGQLITEITPEFNGELQKLHCPVIDL